MDTRDLYKLVRSLDDDNANSIVKKYDPVSIQINEHAQINTAVIGFTKKKNIILEADAKAMELLEMNGLFDEVDQSNVNGNSEIEQFKHDVINAEDPFQLVYDAWGEPGTIGKYVTGLYDEIARDNGLHPDDDFEDIIGLILDIFDEDVGGVSESWANSDHWDSKYDDAEPSDKDASRALARRQAEKDGWSTADERDQVDEVRKKPMHPEVQEIIRLAARDINDEARWGNSDYEEEDELGDIARLAHGNDIDEGIGKTLLGGAAAIAAILGVNEYQANQLMKTEPQLIKLAQMRQEAEAKGDTEQVKSLDDRIEKTLDHITVTGRPVMGDDGEPVVPGEPLGESNDNTRVYVKTVSGQLHLLPSAKIMEKRESGKTIVSHLCESAKRIHSSRKWIINF